jgi:hypothetical protein
LRGKQKGIEGMRQSGVDISVAVQIKIPANGFERELIKSMENMSR